MTMVAKFSLVVSIFTRKKSNTLTKMSLSLIRLEENIRKILDENCIIDFLKNQFFESVLRFQNEGAFLCQRNDIFISRVATDRKKRKTIR